MSGSTRCAITQVDPCREAATTIVSTELRTFRVCDKHRDHLLDTFSEDEIGDVVPIQHGPDSEITCVGCGMTAARYRWDVLPFNGATVCPVCGTETDH